jgi:DNA polymerase-3 subunit gamma/tau
MDYLVSARKWRPQAFKEVIGQQHVAQTLTNAIQQGRIAHAFLFSGGRGVGKTTMARILAKSLNCQSGPASEPCQKCPSCEGITSGHSPDVIEIDGASNRGIDEVRELRETVKYTPMQGRYRVYIIDEVHMLTKEAFNALLKTLEEPPPHVVFVMATTEVHKIPSTILSRCQHFQFRRMSRQEIMGQLEAIAGKEGIGLSAGGSAVLAKVADGSMRDALSLLDQAIAYSGKTVSEEDLAAMLGTPNRDILREMAEAILNRRAEAALMQIKVLLDKGYDLRRFCDELVNYWRDLLMARLSREPETLIDLPKEDVAALSKAAGSVSVEELQRLFGIFSQALEGLRTATHPRFILEMAVIRACELPALESFGDLLEKVERLEKSQPPQSKASAPSPPARSGGDSESPARSSPNASSGTKAEWTDVIQRIREDKASLASYLEGGTVQEVTNEAVTLGFSGKSVFLIDLIQNDENQRIIRDTMTSLFGRPVELKLVRLETPVSTPSPPDGRKKEKIRREVLSNPIVKEALDIFGGDVVEIRDPAGP